MSLEDYELMFGFRIPQARCFVSGGGEDAASVRAELPSKNPVRYAIVEFRNFAAPVSVFQMRAV